MIVNGFGRSTECSDCLRDFSCNDCKAMRSCAANECFRYKRMLGYDPDAYQGLGGIVDSIGEGAKSIAGCPIPFVIGIAVGYLVKKSGMLKKITL